MWLFIYCTRSLPVLPESHVKWLISAHPGCPLCLCVANVGVIVCLVLRLLISYQAMMKHALVKRARMPSLSSIGRMYNAIEFNCQYLVLFPFNASLLLLGSLILCNDEWLCAVVVQYSAIQADTFMVLSVPRPIVWVCVHSEHRGPCLGQTAALEVLV
jgi:hypothetical protein